MWLACAFLCMLSWMTPEKLCQEINPLILPSSSSKSGKGGECIVRDTYFVKVAEFYLNEVFSQLFFLLLKLLKQRNWEIWYKRNTRLGLRNSKGSDRCFMNDKLDRSWQDVLATQKTSDVLGCIKRNVASRSREVILPLSSTAMRPCPQHD